jgi:hypothetical protein
MYYVAGLYSSPDKTPRSLASEVAVHFRKDLRNRQTQTYLLRSAGANRIPLNPSEWRRNSALVANVKCG